MHYQLVNDLLERERGSKGGQRFKSNLFNKNNLPLAFLTPPGSHTILPRVTRCGSVKLEEIMEIHHG